MSFGYRDKDWVELDCEDRCYDCAFFDSDWCLDTLEPTEWDDDACGSFERGEYEE